MTGPIFKTMVIMYGSNMPYLNGTAHTLQNNKLESPRKETVY